MKNNFLWILCFFLFLFSCKKNADASTPQKGEITIVADDAFKNVTEALSERYMAFYPETKINVLYKKEDSAFIDLLQNKIQVIVMSRDLTDKELQLYEDKVDLKFQTAKFAADAVVFVVPNEDPRESISVQEVKDFLTKGKDKTLIFDGNNASNINFVKQKFGLHDASQNLNFGVIRGNDNIIKEVGKYKGKIGVISLNTISRMHSKEINELKSHIKILPVIAEDGKIYRPELGYIKNMQYPFTRILYFLTNEGFFGVSNGFIRFSCTQLGQIVVSKQGLQPYNNYKREVQMR
ncbi:substrate-binding domain-containing protein [Bergeyella zoohelcum]|uniref:PstS family phosphate ABC transporter substrate-binding protein n=1 Tax=Bergeyella zoohelcum TaxID=1015 RepID=UPI002A9157A7|nr:substrate-binding domain-containing protein [Bergeyella zoohelcum]MDY6024720.1 substrate-binding domain-containing protein [Bergeyella zoohelcum]